jgi:hypothetical protein
MWWERNYLVQVDEKDIGLEGRNGRAEKAKAGWIIFISLPPTVESEVRTSDSTLPPQLIWLHVYCMHTDFFPDAVQGL